MPAQSFPLVSLLLPLYKSRPFLAILIENLETLNYPNLEILISDRHCADDALEVLQARYGHDARFHFFRAHDEINWVEHYNFLLRAATGKYFLWMPHDDSYPSDYVTVLAQALENYPDALVAIGGMEAQYADGSTKYFPRRVPFSTKKRWTTRAAFHSFLVGAYWLAFHGVIRREVLLEKNLCLQPTRDTYRADLVWDFAVALSGRVVWAANCYYRKRYYPTSTHALWGPLTWRHRYSEITALRGYLSSPKQTLAEQTHMWLCILFWTALGLVTAFLRPSDFERRHGLMRKARLRWLCL